MIIGIDSYMPKPVEYYQGYKDGYEVAKQEVRDFYERMGMGNNTFTGTACIARTDRQTDKGEV
jgi:hypothetical protein